MQALILKGELALVDDKSCFELPGRDRRDDLVERHDLKLEVAEQQFESEKRRRHRAGHGDALAT